MKRFNNYIYLNNLKYFTIFPFFLLFINYFNINKKKMSTVFSSFFVANKIRTKLLLYIDQEIQSKIKQNKLKNNLQKYDKTKFSKKNVKTYTYQPNIIFMSSINFFDFSNSKNTKNRKSSNKSCSTCEITPNDYNILSQSKNNLVSVHNSGLVDSNKISYHNIIYFHKKYYSIKRNLKHSSTLQIYKKPKTDRKYLKKLCDSLKISAKKNTLSSFNKNGCKFLVNNVNKGDSSPIKRIKRRNKNNTRF